MKRPASAITKKPAAHEASKLTTAQQLGSYLFGHGEEETQRRLAKLSETQRQTLTKMFERARKENSQEYDAEGLRGPGANRKKSQLLLAWLQHGFSETYCELAAKMVLTQSRTTREEWIPLNEAKKSYGPKELRTRLKKGSLEWRRDPDDQEFFQVRKRREFRETGTTKQKELSARSVASGSGSRPGAARVWEQLESESQEPGWSDLKMSRAKKPKAADKPGGDLGAIMALLDAPGAEAASDAEAASNGGGEEGEEEDPVSQSEEEPPLAIKDQTRGSARSSDGGSKVGLEELESTARLCGAPRATSALV